MQIEKNKNRDYVSKFPYGEIGLVSVFVRKGRKTIRLSPKEFKVEKNTLTFKRLPNSYF